VRYQAAPHPDVLNARAADGPGAGLMSAFDHEIYFRRAGDATRPAGLPLRPAGFARDDEVV
jgi:hypothetical protein